MVVVIFPRPKPTIEKTGCREKLVRYLSPHGKFSGKGVEVVTALPGAPALGLLQPEAHRNGERHRPGSACSGQDARRRARGNWCPRRSGRVRRHWPTLRGRRPLPAAWLGAAAPDAAAWAGEPAPARRAWAQAPGAAERHPLPTGPRAPAAPLPRAARALAAARQWTPRAELPPAAARARLAARLPAGAPVVPPAPRQGSEPGPALARILWSPVYAPPACRCRAPARPRSIQPRRSPAAAARG